MADRAWRVGIVEHPIPPRWRIPAWSGEVRASSANGARITAIRDAHIREGVPAWRPLMRKSWPHTTILGDLVPEELAQF